MSANWKDPKYSTPPTEAALDEAIDWFQNTGGNSQVYHNATCAIYELVRLRKEVERLNGEVKRLEGKLVGRVEVPDPPLGESSKIGFPEPTKK